MTSLKNPYCILKKRLLIPPIPSMSTSNQTPHPVAPKPVLPPAYTPSFTFSSLPLVPPLYFYILVYAPYSSSKNTSPVRLPA